MNEHKGQYAFTMIEAFINSQYKSKTSYCEANGIYIKEFNSKLDYIKVKYPDLYQRYVEHINNIKQEKAAISARKKF